MRRPSERRSVSRSAIRALNVLEHFGRVRRALRAIEISQALDLQPSTTDQLLKTMVDSGHLAFEARTKTYFPSHRLGGFSAWIVESYGGEDRLRQLVQQVQAQSGEVVTLTTANDLFMQILDQAGSGPNGRSPERGLRISVFGSAVGAAYLSLLDEAEVRRLAVRARLSLHETISAVNAAAQVRREGHAEGATPDGSLWTLAAALPARRFPLPLVLGLAGPAERLQANRSRLHDILRTAVAGFA